MTSATVLGLVLATSFAVHGLMMVLALPVMRAGAASVGFSVRQYRFIGLLEIAAAVGLVAGFVSPLPGIAAGTGLVSLMAAALVVHWRAGDPVVRMIPALVLGCMATAYVVLFLARLS